MGNITEDYNLEPYLESDFRNPGKKFIPTDEDFNNLQEGDRVMVKFSNSQHQVEQLVIKIKSMGADNLSFTGKVSSKPEILSSPKEGEEVNFGARNISGILT